MSRAAEPHRRRGRLLGGALVVLLLLVWLAWWKADALRRVWGGRPPADVAPVETATSDAPEPLDAELSERERARRRWSEMLGGEPRWPADFAAPQSCDAVEAELRHLCGLLDAREYIRASATPTDSCGLLRQVAEELSSRPPDISSELRSYEAMLGNAFHLFRTLGRRRTELLRRIVWEEQELVEPGGLVLFRWAISRERCAGPRGTPLKLESLYAHAAFVFQTFGGQAYLRRRAPRTEGLVGFYALMVLDRAQGAKHDPAGVDPRPEIQRVRALLAREPLVFRDDYLRVLDEMAERWKQKIPPADPSG